MLEGFQIGNIFRCGVFQGRALKNSLLNYTLLHTCLCAEQNLAAQNKMITSQEKM